MNIFNLFRKFDDEFQIPKRIIQPMYIKDETYRNAYIKDGFVIIKNVVSDEIIQQVIDTHEKITKMPGYFESDKLQTTIAFGSEIHSLAIQMVQELSPKIFTDILNSDLCSYDFGGGIIIKNKGGWFAPHQDCSIIDEYQGTTTYAWIPTEKMHDDNGTFYAIPGSHLWAAWQRSSQYPSWPLKQFSKFLWKKMVPLYLEKGDVLLFDSALIHASGENKTNHKRLAFNSCIIEKEAQHVQYVSTKETPSNHIEKYLVDLSYWYKGDLWDRPKGYEKIEEPLIYPKHFSKKFLENLIKQYNSYA